MGTKERKIEDVLRIEGVKSRGYGTVPKAIMRDRDISIFAKAIYSYFCSLSGKGDTVFPGRDKILYDLQISKDAYYKGLKELIHNGYILVHQENSNNQGSGYKRNVYTLTARPSKYANYDGTNPQAAAVYRKIYLFGLDAIGYGLIPYAVMSDERLRSQPKAVYAYISSHAGDQNHTELDSGIMQQDLGLKDRKTNQRYIRQLRELNYINVIRLHKNGKLSGIQYQINPTPDLSVAQKKIGCSVLPDTAEPNIEKQGIAAQPTVLQDTEVQETVLQDTEVQETVLQDTEVQETVLQDTEAQETVLQDTVLQDTVLQDTVLQDTNNNSLTNNSSTIISLTNNSIVIDRLITRVRNAINYEVMCWMYDKSVIEKEALDNLVLAVTEALASPNPRISISGTPYLASHVRDVLLTINGDAVYRVLERFLTRTDKISAQNHKQYLLTAIFNELKYPTGNNDGCEDDFTDSGQA